jgi:hypothetical protein
MAEISFLTVSVWHDETRASCQLFDEGRVALKIEKSNLWSGGLNIDCC